MLAYMRAHTHTHSQTTDVPGSVGNVFAVEIFSLNLKFICVLLTKRAALDCRVMAWVLLGALSTDAIPSTAILKHIHFIVSSGVF